jgi:hypothetical protein
MTPLDVVTLNQAKTFLRVDFEDDDDLITSLIEGAVGYVEQDTQYRLYQRSEIIYTSGKYCYSCFQFPLNAVTVVNQDSSDTTVYNAKLYYESLRTNITWLTNGFLYWDSWNQFFTNYYYTVHNSCSATFILTLDVGYTDVSLIPNDLITAIKQIINYTYENRDMSKVDLPSNITMLLSKYRRFVTLL